MTQMLSQTNTDRVEELRQAGLAKTRAGELEESIALYDEALSTATDETARELITINKADSLIALERTGPEVQALPRILLRRRNSHHTFLAAYALTFKHRIASEAKRGIFYGEIALEAANEASEPFWRLAALNELGIIYEMDSQFEQAIENFRHALTLLDSITDGSDHSISYSAALQNIGACQLLSGETDEGIAAIRKALPKIQSPGALAEAYIDLCYGYLEKSELEQSRYYGDAGLELATEERQIRNAHYLLGEVAYKVGDTELANFHFDELARFYPQFRNLKSLLFAIDLRSMVNFKL
jgi:tetratricopeptide (TPR) repeat protein